MTKKLEDQIEILLELANVPRARRDKARDDLLQHIRTARGKCEVPTSA
jgi:hypothetical protein